MKRILTFFLMTALVLSMAGCGSSGDTEEAESKPESEPAAEADTKTDANATDDRTWSDSEIASYLAVPDSENIEVVEDADDYFSFKVTGATEEDYETYVGGCRYFGFTQDVKETDDSFEAASDDGYRIHVSYDAGDESYTGSIEPM